MSTLSVTVPEILAEKIFFSDVYQNFNARGIPSGYEINLEFPPINLFQRLKSSDQHVLQCKVENTLATWAKKYERHLAAEHRERRAEDVERLNSEAQESLAELEGILFHTLEVDDAIDWEAVKRKEAFRVNPDQLVQDPFILEHLKCDHRGNPSSISYENLPKEPYLDEVTSKYGFFARIFRKKFINEIYQEQHSNWQKKVTEVKRQNRIREDSFKKAANQFRILERAFEEEKQKDNEALEDIRKRYLQAEPRAVEEYCDLVLAASVYPDYFPRNWSLEYREDSKLVVVEMDLPTPDSLPAAESFRYVKSRDEVVEKKLPEAKLRKLYDSVIYQICIRTLHELFEADKVDALEAVAFNGVIESRNKATGSLESKVILSASVDKEKFSTYDLENIDPKATFKHIKGVAAAALHELTPIPPVIQLNKGDRRFIEGRSVDVDSSVNLAAMHWGDFEHLIREIFEQEFATGGGEVKVTQASADGGVDAIAFDPDPLRGGKIVIQAKRYTNVVGVSAVRDLYGTVLNEGAIKGILVTTSDYGKDSYEFAKDKPIFLLNGSNLLSLLEKHGRKARIDTAEAKRIFQGNGR